MNTIFDIQRPENLPAEYADLTISDCILLAMSKNKLKPAEKKLVNDYKKIVAKEEKTKAAALAKKEKANAKAEAIAQAKAEKAEAVARAKAEKAEAIALAKAEKAEAIALAKAEKAIKAKETRAAKAKAARAAKAVAAKAVAAAANTEENAVNAIVKEKRARVKKPTVVETPIVETDVETPIVETDVETPIVETVETPIVEEKHNDEHLVEDVYVEKEKPKSKVVKKPAAEKKPKHKKSTDV